MREIFFKLIKLDAQNFIPEVWYAVWALWIAVIIFAWVSIYSQPISSGGKLSWAVLVLAIPFLGMVAYCFYCMSKVDYHLLDFLTVKKSGKKRNASRQML
jgi:uncharacterized membrane protein YhaH (DUF805 family)